jgi:hypothetical protein
METRGIILAWPAGEEREVAIRWGSPGSCITLAEANKAVEAGYLVVGADSKKSYGGGGYQHVVGCMYTRTEKPIRPPRPRGYDPRYAEKNLFPWPVEQHWALVEKSQARAVLGIARKLGADSPSLTRRYPQIVKSKAEMVNIRKALLDLFGEGNEWRWLPASLKYLIATGEGLRLLCMDLLIEPVITNGKFVRFNPVDSKTAFEEIEYIVCGTDKVATRYTTYQERIACAQAA